MRKIITPTVETWVCEWRFDRLPETREEIEMVKRTNQTVVNELDKLNEKETAAVVNYISQILSVRLSKQSELQPNDDLIVFLSDKRENRRARQVLEWERVRRQNAQRNAWKIWWWNAEMLRR